MRKKNDEDPIIRNDDGEDGNTRVRMFRDPQTNPRPFQADVHPDEVEAWKRSGWQILH